MRNILFFLCLLPMFASAQNGIFNREQARFSQRLIVPISYGVPADSQTAMIYFDASIPALRFYNGNEWASLTGIIPIIGGDTAWIKFGNNLYSNVTGNVGVGTSNPQYPFDVNGNARFGGVLCDGIVNCGASNLVFGNHVVLGGDDIYCEGAMGGLFGNHHYYTNGGVSLGAGNNLNNAGYSGNIMLGDKNSTTLYSTANNQLNLRFSGGVKLYTGDTTTTVLSTTASGNIGIGISAPTSKLDVNGNIKSHGNIEVINGDLIITSKTRSTSWKIEIDDTGNISYTLQP